jgi:hypothetical protein
MTDAPLLESFELISISAMYVFVADYMYLYRDFLLTVEGF